MNVLKQDAAIEVSSLASANVHNRSVGGDNHKHPKFNRLRLSQLTFGIAATLATFVSPTQATIASGAIGSGPIKSVPTPSKPIQTASLTTPQTNPASGPSIGSATAAKVDRSSEALGCLIEPSVVVEVGSPVSGLIDRVVVERGDIIRKGQTVASLDARVERASMALANTRLRNEAEMRSAESSLDFAKRKHDRNESLHRDGIVSAQIREQAEAEAKMADQRLNQAREQRSVAAQEVELSKAQLALRTISSPVSGVVIERYLSAGERVDEKPILKVAQIHPLRVEAILPASMYGKIKTGMTMMVSPELTGAKPRAAPVTIVDRVIDPASNSFRVRMEMPNADHSLPSGVRCKVQTN